MIELAKRAKCASKTMALLTNEEKNNALQCMAAALVRRQGDILAANLKDVQRGKAEGMSDALIDRLTLTESRIKDMADGLLDLMALPDPIGAIDETWINKDGLEISKVRVPLGVVAMVYEARPNVTVDAVGLCLKSGNAVILRGSRSALSSNSIIAQILQEAAEGTAVPRDAVQLVEDVRHESVNELLSLNEYVDLAIPRGGSKLISSVVQHATVPVIATGVGNCHLYVDAAADLDKARQILMNGKVQRPGVCNALETLLVHRDVADRFLQIALNDLSSHGVEIRGCEETRARYEAALPATEEDYATEFHDLVIAVRVVESADEAIHHINTYGTGHSEVMVSEDYSLTRKFLKEIDAACVYINASSRFSDGSQFGFGAEIGISTQKMHARGPMGIAALTSHKYTILGEGQIRA